MNPRIEYFAPCTLGLELALRGEIDDLGASWSKEQRGGVSFGGDRRIGYLANM